MASFRKRDDLQWQARVARKGFPAQVKTFNAKPEAEAWAATVESAMARGTFVSSAESEHTTFREALERYQREITVEKKGAMSERSRIKNLLGSPSPYGRWRVFEAATSPAIVIAGSKKCLPRQSFMRSTLFRISSMYPGKNGVWRI